MKQRMIAIVLAICALAAITACGTPLSRPKEAGTTYPYIFVHGLNGIGDDAGLPVSYWGSTAGPLLPALEQEGYLCFAPTVSAAGSAWDRACELFAAITGTRVDYGAAHSEAHEHPRFGQTYGTALVPDWGTVDAKGNLRKINIIAHSFGGATARLLSGLLQNGSEAEQYISKKGQLELSPLFEGGKGDWIFSLTTLASPHNGVSLLSMVDINPGISWVANLLGSNEWLDEALHAAGVAMGGKSFGEILRAAKTQDTAYYDLTLEGAQAVTRLAPLHSETYYFSYPVDGTNNGKPTDDMSLPLRVLGSVIGNFTDEAAGIDDTWRPNDGLVNTISATAPFGQPSKKVDDASALTPASLIPASWHVMPTERGDHGSIIGMARTKEETLQLYLDQMRRVDALSKAVTG